MGVDWKMVGVRGLEPPASASRRQRSTRLSYTPNSQTGLDMSFYTLRDYRPGNAGDNPVDRVSGFLFLVHQCPDLLEREFASNIFWKTRIDILDFSY